jgi:hypothetical protein
MALAREGYTYFDLTPGGGYKAQLATATDHVWELSALNARQALQLKQRARVRRFALACLNRFGVSTTAARLAVKRARKMAQSILSGGPAPRLVDRYCFYRAAPSPADDAVSLPLKVNRIDDLLHYDEAAGVKSYHQFQYDAMKRLESRQQLYSSTNGERLLFCAWAGRRAEIDFAQDGEEVPADVADGIAIYDIYWHAQADRDVQLQSFLKQILRDLHDRFGADMVELVLHAHDRTGRTEAERAGFRLVSHFPPAGASAMPAPASLPTAGAGAQGQSESIS